MNDRKLAIKNAAFVLRTMKRKLHFRIGDSVDYFLGSREGSSVVASIAIDATGESYTLLDGFVVGHAGNMSLNQANSKKQRRKNIKNVVAAAYAAIDVDSDEADDEPRAPTLDEAYHERLMLAPGDMVEYVGSGMHKPGRTIITKVSVNLNRICYGTMESAWWPREDFRFLDPATVDSVQEVLVYLASMDEPDATHVPTVASMIALPVNTENDV